MADKTEDTPLLEIRKYPNRRYYDTTHSRHITLDEIHAAIKKGHDIRVTDSKSGDDITGKVLTQIILEMDSLKLDLFPVSMLTQIIRMKGGFMKDYMDGYFNRALTSFMDMREKSMHSNPLGDMSNWTKAWMGPFSNPFFPGGGTGREDADDETPPDMPPEPSPEPPPDNADESVEATLERLQKEMAAIRESLNKPGPRK